MNCGANDVHPATNCVDPATNRHKTKVFLKTRGTGPFSVRNYLNILVLSCYTRVWNRGGTSLEQTGNKIDRQASSGGTKTLLSKKTVGGEAGSDVQAHDTNVYDQRHRNADLS